jgi:hypothetical protein
MSKESNVSLDVNLEFLRKQAKSLLKLCRSRDAAALDRMRARLPRFASLDDGPIANAICLADIQHALAREHGYANWSELRRHDGRQQSLTDFSLAGADGSLPDDFIPWQWGLSYTLRPQPFSTFEPGEEYRIVVYVLQPVRDKETFSAYATMYQRVTDIANARAAQLTAAGKNGILHKRILTQGWFRHRNIDLDRVFLTLGISCLDKKDQRRQGETAPTAEELAKPGGMTPENVNPAAVQVHKHVHEQYGEFGLRSSNASGIFTVSYGEYVETCAGLDYEPFVQRAEQLARFHHPFLVKDTPARSETLNIVRREWFCATNPDIAVVHVYIRV